MFLNQILQHGPSGKRVRILDLDVATDTVWLIDISSAKGLPAAYPTSEVRDAITDSIFAPVENGPPAPLRSPSAAATTRRDKAYAAIEPLVKTRDIYDPAMRSALVQARAAALRCSPQTLYKHLRNWWQGGQSRNSLIPRFHAIGSQAGHTGNRGRPPIFSDRPIYQIGKADQALMSQMLQQYYLQSEVVTLVATYQRLLEHHYSYIDSEGMRCLRAPGEYPSEAQFRNFVKKHLPKELSIRARKGNEHFELNHRPKLGSLRHQTYTVGDVYEIDATIADVFLVHPENRSLIIGKPVLYIVKDRKSGLVVGFYIGLENPSWLAAMHAIKSIAEDKAALCQRHGLPYDPADWPAQGVLPKTLVGDRGSDMLSDASTQLADGLEVTMQNLPTRRADWKPHVECGFKQLQRSMADCVPAYEPPENFGKRQKRDYSQDAALTLHEFTGIVLAAIIRTNRQPMLGYDLAPRYVLEGMSPTPINIWNAEVRDRAGLLSRFTEEELRFALLPRAKATVSRDGIRFGDCYYSAPEALAKGWFVASGRGSFEVSVSYDRRLVDAIYVHDDRCPDGYFIASLLDKCSHYRGMSFAEVECYTHLSKIQRQLDIHTKRQLQSDFHGHVDPTVSQARALTQVAATGKSRAKRKKDTVVARADAMSLQRQSEARLNENEAQLAPAASGQTSALTASTLASAPPVARRTNATKSRLQKYEELLNGR